MAIQRRALSRRRRSAVMALVLLASSGCGSFERRITIADYEDKVYASWLGQCVGNMYGLAHEWKYIDEPRTEPITGYDPKILDKIRAAGGAFSDDDTDIEYVDLFVMEKYGPEPTYENLAEFWQRCINDHIWVANRAARDLMKQGYLPPHTGRRGLNPHWDKIDPQLVCEIWAVTAPGMLRYAAAKADWAAKVTNDDYGTHPTIWYNTMYAAAFYQTDVERLCQIGYEHLPAGSIFRTAIDDVRQWKREAGNDWVTVRRKIKEKYLDGVGLPADITKDKVSGLLNGTLGVLALLYGGGDFESTLNLSCMAGYDADNQCATLAGLLALMKGSASIPRKYLYLDEGWTRPLNDRYRNLTRDELPDGNLTDMARRTAAQGRELVLRTGGRVESLLGRETLVIRPDARFTAPLEVRIFPVHIPAGREAVVRPEVVGGAPGARISVGLAGTLPGGMEIDRRDGQVVIAGTPKREGRYDITATVSDGTTSRSVDLRLVVDAPTAGK